MSITPAVCWSLCHSPWSPAGAVIHPLCGNGSGSPGHGVLASCGSHREHLPVSGSSRDHPKSVETQGLMGSCRQPGMGVFALHDAEGLLRAPACSCGAVWRQGLLQSTPACTHRIIPDAKHSDLI